MKNLQIAICEDDQTDQKQLADSLRVILDSYGINYQFQYFFSGEALLASDIDFQLIFMDIAMEGKNGIETGRQIYSKNPSVKIIYQTNFGNYCQEAVNTVHAFAFLEKPVSEELVHEQIDEFLKQNQREEFCLEFHKVSFMENGILVEKPIVQIPVNTIYYFEVLKSKKKIKIVTEHECYEYPDTMKHLEARLQSFDFAISCRGILVNLRNVAKIKDYKVFIKNGETVALSQKRAVSFKERLNECVHKGE